MSELATKIFNNIAQNNQVGIVKSTRDAIDSKLNDAFEVRKVNLAANIFSNKDEETKEEETQT